MVMTCESYYPRGPLAIDLSRNSRRPPPVFYCRSNTRMFASLSPTMCLVIVKVLESEESSISCV
jgi:hypothetical protein